METDGGPAVDQPADLYGGCRPDVEVPLEAKAARGVRVMDTVWVQGVGDVLIRANSIVVLAMGQDGLRTECVSGRVVRLTDDNPTIRERRLRRCRTRRSSHQRRMRASHQT